MTTYSDVLVRLRADASPFIREMTKARAAVKGIGDDIDTTNDRTAWLAQGFMALAPALVPLGAAAVPILAGIATQATIGVGAIGTMALAFSGVGDTLKALNKYQLEPTAENFAALQIEMEKLGPDGAEFVKVLDDVGSKLSVLRMDARGGMFPGMTEGLESLLGLLPRLRRIVADMAEGIGQLSAEGAAGLAGPEFREFFRYLQTDAKDILVDMGRTIGNFADGFASMLVAFGPLTADFSDGFLGMSRDFERWAEGLSSSQGFAEFVQYVEDSGPHVTDMLGSLADAFVQIVQAAAPLGGPTLEAFARIFDVIAKIADTPLGTLLILTGAITGLIGRFQALRTITTGGVVGPLTKGFRDSGNAAKAAIPSIGQFGTALGTAARSQRQLQQNMLTGSRAYADASRRASQAKFAVGDFARAAAPAAAAGGLLAVTMTGVADSAGLGNTAMGGMIGLMATGGPWGAAVGAAIGLAADLAAANNDIAAAVEQANDAMDSGDIQAMTVAYENLQARMEDQQSITGVGDAFQHTAQAIGVAINSIDMLWGGDSGTKPLDEQADAYRKLRSEVEFFNSALSGAGWKTDGLELFNAALGRTADGAERASDEMRQFTAEVATAMGILDKQAALDAFEAAIDDARKGFKEFGATLDENKNAGRENRANLRDIAETALTASEHLRGMAKVDFLRNAQREFLKMADLLGMNEREARRFARSLFNLDALEAHPGVQLEDKEGRAQVRRLMRELGLLHGTKAEPSVALLYQQFLRGKITVEDMLKVLNGWKATPTVTANTSDAVAKIHGVIGLLSSVRDKVVHITTVFERHNINVNRAQGGLISGPGGPTDDIVPVMASNREYIVKAAAVEKYGVAMFDAYNSMAVPTGPVAVATEANRFAGGGPIRAQAAGGWGGTSRQILEVRVSGEMDLQKAVAQIRQATGNIAVHAARDEYGQQRAFNRNQYGDN